MLAKFNWSCHLETKQDAVSKEAHAEAAVVLIILVDRRAGAHAAAAAGACEVQEA